MTEQLNQASLKDIIDSAALIQEYVKGLTFPEFEKDTMRFLAVSRLFEIVGEATKNLSPDFKLKYPNVSWKKMAGLRDVIIHDYQELTREMIYKIAAEDIPNPISELKKI